MNDEKIRNILISSAYTFKIDDDDETFFQYWIDDRLTIRR